jgi:hypothetical protein
MNVTEWASVNAVAASTMSRRRRDPTMSASRNRMWSMPVSRCSAPRWKNSQNRSPTLCSVEDEVWPASSAALPDRPSSAYWRIVLVPVT